MKKAQVRMIETIAILFIFFVLILFGMIFFFQYQKVSIKEKQEELLANRAMETTLRTLFLPELICSRGEAEPEDNCFDLLKLEHVKEVFDENLEDYYFDLFSYANITVHKVFPEDSSGEEIVIPIYEKVKPGYTRAEPTFFVVTLRDQREDEEYGLGYLKVEVYS